MGDSKRHCTLYRPNIWEQYSSYHDRTADYERKTQESEICKEQERDCNWRIWFRKDPVLCKTKSNADGKIYQLCGHGPQGKCETFQSEKDWHISTESLFIVMKLVRVGELNAWIVEWRGNALKGYSNTPAGMEMSKHWNVRSPVKSAERYRNNSSWRKLSRGGWCILYAGSL